MKYGEVWLVDFAPKIGQEVDKKRPAIIVNHDSMGALDLKIVVPVTEPGKSIRDWHFPLIASGQNGLTKNSVADCFQVKSISHDRFVRPLGVLSGAEMDGIKLVLMTVLNLL